MSNPDKIGLKFWIRGGLESREGFQLLCKLWICGWDEFVVVWEGTKTQPKLSVWFWGICTKTVATEALSLAQGSIAKGWIQKLLSLWFCSNKGELIPAISSFALLYLTVSKGPPLEFPAHFSLGFEPCWLLLFDEFSCSWKLRGELAGLPDVLLLKWT